MTAGAIAAGMDEWRHRYYALRTVAFQIPTIICLFLLDKAWKVRGGDNQADGFDWTTDTVADKVHPNAQGAEKMAARWFAALTKVLGK